MLQADWLSSENTADGHDVGHAAAAETRNTCNNDDDNNDNN